MDDTKLPNSPEEELTPGPIAHEEEPLHYLAPDNEWHARHNRPARRPFPLKRAAVVLLIVLLMFAVSIVGGVAGFVALANNNSVFAKQIRKTFNLDDLTELRVPIVQDIKLQENSAIIDAAKKVSPAVVSITANATVTDFYGQTSNQEISGGTGFILTSDGLIITNKHVVTADANYKVVLSDGRVFDATVKAKDPLNDLAVVKIEATGLPTVELGSSADLQIGQSVIAIGNALGQFNNSVTYGVISAKNRTLDDVGESSGTGTTETLNDLLQTDASINPGNSGGPLVNLAGQVVGIDTAIASTTGGSIGLGFAIAIDSVKNIIESVRQTGEIIRPYMGVRYVPVTKAVQAEKSLSVDYGALIQGSSASPAIVAGGPAEKAGLQANDIILEINGERIDQDNTLSSRIVKYNVGDKLTLKILRNAVEQTVTVTLERLPNS